MIRKYPENNKNRFDNFGQVFTILDYTPNHSTHISGSAHQKPNFTNLKFQYPHFWVYFDINLKLLSGKNTQKVNQQKNRCKNLGFIIGCSMS